MKLNVLITCVGGEYMPSVLADLRNYPGDLALTIIGVDVEETAIGKHFVDVFELVPYGKDPTYIKRIMEIVNKYDVGLIIPTSDDEALSLSRSRNEILQKSCQLACTDAGILEIISCKTKAYKYFEEIGLPTPSWVFANSYDSLVLRVNEMITKHGDIVVKESEQRGGRGVYIISEFVDLSFIVDGGREIHSNLKDFFDKYIRDIDFSKDVMVMERLLDPVHDLDLFGVMGEPVAVVPRRRVNSSVPNEGHLVFQDEELEALGVDIIHKLKLNWLYDCDIMFDKNSQPKILEINPRPSGSVAASIAAGIPLMQMLIDFALKKPLNDSVSFTDCLVLPFKSLKVITT